MCGVRSDITPYTSAGHSIVGNDPCVVPFQLNVTCRSVLCYGRRRLIPPHQSLSRQLSPKGKPFCESLFALHDKMMRADRKGKPQCKAIFTMFAQRTEGFPSGGSWRRRRLMRGDKSALSIGMYLSPQTARPAYRSARPARKTSAKPHPAQNPHLPDKQKLPHRTPPLQKAKQIIAHVMAGFCGEVLGERGRFGGREPRLSRGGSLPPRSFLTPSALPHSTSSCRDGSRDSDRRCRERM